MKMNLFSPSDLGGHFSAYKERAPDTAPFFFLMIKPSNIKRAPTRVPFNLKLGNLREKTLTFTLKRGFSTTRFTRVRLKLDLSLPPEPPIQETSYCFFFNPTGAVGLYF